MIKKVSLLIEILFLGYFFIHCDNQSDIEECGAISDLSKAIELIYPRGGESFTIGNSVKVRWKVRRNIVEMVMLQVSTSGINGPWRNILGRGMVVPDTAEIVCMDTIWT
ncbi:MAG: hypothetical protein N2053_11715, partial [Chitinispirillaceae bacterium]|nr:hypothetical protein [Chitinispirillaceae bacterium]